MDESHSFKLDWTKEMWPGAALRSWSLKGFWVLIIIGWPIHLPTQGDKLCLTQPQDLWEALADSQSWVLAEVRAGGRCQTPFCSGYLMQASSIPLPKRTWVGLQWVGLDFPIMTPWTAASFPLPSALNFRLFCFALSALPPL